MRCSRICTVSIWLPIAAVIAVSAAACQRQTAATTPRPIPALSVQVGACATPGRDGRIGSAPRLERADRDLNGDGVPEAIVVDRSLCTAEGNCYWNVFSTPSAGSGECARFAGSLDGSALEPLPTKGDDQMADVRSYWNAYKGRLYLHTYRFQRGGYRLVETLACTRANDDKLECVDTER
jgi:hypothetical protein